MEKATSGDRLFSVAAAAVLGQGIPRRRSPSPRPAPRSFAPLFHLHLFSSTSFFFSFFSFSLFDEQTCSLTNHGRRRSRTNETITKKTKNNSKLSHSPLLLTPSSAAPPPPSSLPPTIVCNNKAPLCAPPPLLPQAQAMLTAGDPVKNARALLRNALPIDNKPMRTIQAALEGVSEQLRVPGSKALGPVSRALKRASGTLASKRGEISAAFAPSKKAAGDAALDGLDKAL